MPADILSSRLRLVALRLEALQALRSFAYQEASGHLGWGLTPEFRDSLGERFLAMQLELVQEHPERHAWCVRAMVRRQDGLVMGHTGFHGPPEIIGRAEIGYHVFVANRGFGYATEACRALVDWARDQGHPKVFACVSPSNAPSLAVVARLGFKRSAVQSTAMSDEEELFEVSE